MKIKKNLVLLGMMGVGKTVIGKYVARKLRINFFDIDKLIEKKNKMTIAEIFKLKGEACFRKEEEFVTIKYLNEKGINTLFLAIGFVEWYEKKTSDLKLLSPLLLLSVDLEEIKKTKGSEFHLSASNAELQVNIALKAKFEKDFGMVLDDAEEEDTPEKYFERFENSIASKKKWSLKRFMTLGHFQFQRMAMYYDLDQANWTELGSQQSLQDIFSGSGESDGTGAEEYDVDEKEISSKVPLLLNQADSSQFSAIVDVMDGKNLALQGPPGTGKSQTITNIIGAALAENKRVLFLDH